MGAFSRQNPCPFDAPRSLPKAARQHIKTSPPPSYAQEMALLNHFHRNQQNSRFKAIAAASRSKVELQSVKEFLLG